MSGYIDIFTAGALGYNADMTPMELDPEWFNALRNMRCSRGEVEYMPGDTQVYGTPTIDPHFALYVESATQNVWAYLGLDHAYAINGTTHTKITRQTAMVDVIYTGTANDRWSGVSWGDLAYFTNNVDAPQVWDTPEGGVLLKDLPNWPAGDTCRIIRNFGPYMLALGYTTGGVYYPRRMRWSHPADPGSYPTSWDITDETRDAGDREIGGAEHGRLTDARMLDKICMLYQQGAIYQMRLIGGALIFDTSKPHSQEVGSIAQDCVKSFAMGKMHFVPGAEDIVVVSVDGVQSIADKRVQKILANSVSSTDYDKAFTVHNYRDREMWYCFPGQGSTTCNLALIFNYRDNTWTMRDLPNVRYGSTGIVVPNSVDDTWDAGLDETWDTGGDVVWDHSYDDSLRRHILFCKENKLLQGNVGTTSDGTTLVGYAERSDIAFIGRGRDGKWKVEPRQNKLITEVWIKASGAAFRVQIGTQTTVEGAVTWSAPKTFNPGTDQKLDFTVGGRVMAIRFESISTEFWAVKGWSVRMSLLGRYA